MSTIEDPVLAKPANFCCLKGSIHSGEPAGKVVQIGGVDTYIATPEVSVSNGNVLLFFPDAFGLHVNNFLTMDAFAACGYLTLGVDYFAGVRSHSSPCKKEEAYSADIGPYMEAFPGAFE
jgi:dienelactone hydrolase